MLRAFSLKSPLPWAMLLGACFAASCDEKGTTSSCPPLPLYQSYPLGDASLDAAAGANSVENQRAFAAAVDAGCATAPTQFPYDANAGAAGEAGSTGTSGATSRGGASSAGASGKGGSSGFGGSSGLGNLGLGGSSGHAGGAG